MKAFPPFPPQTFANLNAPQNNSNLFSNNFTVNLSQKSNNSRLQNPFKPDSMMDNCPNLDTFDNTDFNFNEITKPKSNFNILSFEFKPKPTVKSKNNIWNIRSMGRANPQKTKVMPKIKTNFQSFGIRTTMKLDKKKGGASFTSNLGQDQSLSNIQLTPLNSVKNFERGVFL